MRRLMLLRHAKSDWSAPGTLDQDRPLSARGREAAPKMGNYMARHALVPDLIVASPATRVTETLALVVPSFAKQPKAMPDARLYETDADELLKVIKETPRSAHSLLLVGHNPSLAELASLLMATLDQKRRSKVVTLPLPAARPADSSP